MGEVSVGIWDSFVFFSLSTMADKTLPVPVASTSASASTSMSSSSFSPVMSPQPASERRQSRDSSSLTDTTPKKKVFFLLKILLLQLTPFFLFFSALLQKDLKGKGKKKFEPGKKKGPGTEDVEAMDPFERLVGKSEGLWGLGM